MVARDWISVQLLLPEVLADLRASMTSPYDTEEWILAGYVLNPLCDFRLIEAKAGRLVSMVEKNDLIRTTQLWNRFIQFPTGFATVSPN